MEPILSDFQKATTKLDEVLQMEKNEITRDSAIKRFELCFDLAWKGMKIRARQEGLECYSPRQCFKTGFQIGLINQDEKWLRMIEDRNKTVHIYKEEYADEVYRNLQDYLQLFKELAHKLS